MSLLAINKNANLSMRVTLAIIYLQIDLEVKKGKRANLIIPIVRGKMKTLIIVVNNSRIIHYKIISNSNCNGLIFSQFITNLFEIINTNTNFKTL